MLFYTPKTNLKKEKLKKRNKKIKESTPQTKKMRGMWKKTKKS